MKKFLITWSLCLTVFGSALADEVQPIDTDSYKSIILTVKILDDRKLPDANTNTGLYFSFGNEGTHIPTKAASKGSDLVKQLTIPLEEDGTFSIYYYSSYSSYSYYNKFYLVRGVVPEGIKQIEVRLKRIDVHNMKVTRPDGSTYIVQRGDADITASNVFSDSFYTGYGTDVPVGYVYDIKVSADTEDGNDSYSARLDFTKL